MQSHIQIFPIKCKHSASIKNQYLNSYLDSFNVTRTSPAFQMLLGVRSILTVLMTSAVTAQHAFVGTDGDGNTIITSETGASVLLNNLDIVAAFTALSNKVNSMATQLNLTQTQLNAAFVRISALESENVQLLSTVALIQGVNTWQNTSIAGLAMSVAALNSSVVNVTAADVGISARIASLQVYVPCFATSTPCSSETSTAGLANCGSAINIDIVTATDPTISANCLTFVSGNLNIDGDTNGGSNTVPKTVAIPLLTYVAGYFQVWNGVNGGVMSHGTDIHRHSLPEVRRPIFWS